MSTPTGNPSPAPTTPSTITDPHHQAVTQWLAASKLGQSIITPIQQKAVELLIKNITALPVSTVTPEYLHTQFARILQALKQHQSQQQAQAGQSGASNPNAASAAVNASAAIASNTTPNLAALRSSPAQDISLADEDIKAFGATPSNTSVTVANPGPQPWPNANSSRSTLTAGLAGGRISGTPTLLSRGNEDLSMFQSPDWVNVAKQRKNSAAEQAAMKRTIQDLVSSIDPNVKIEPEVEELLLEIADEFVDSASNFACKLARHRGGDVLEVRDLQLHLERNHNIRIPGFASDETRMAISQSAAPSGLGGTAANRRNNMQMTLRSARLNAVQMVKRDAKLL
ncbi:transcription initiation factor TFIID subunit A-domain-containing protein [Auriculariales sp. MPI-PUGE-AT-0066]|nr:transcription initiation factor TFIID subunit A-domain-containing protein [Auriculariales sp. MPI-PUGE-AT-0066]